MIGWGHFFRVSGLSHQVPGSGIQVRVQVQEICHQSSVIDSVLFSGGRWRPRVAGGRLFHSVLYSASTLPTYATFSSLRCLISDPMRLLALFSLSLLTLNGFAVEGPSANTVPPKSSRPKPGAQLPESVEGVSAEAYVQVKRALLATFNDEAMVAARKEVNKLKERSRFVKGRNESEDMRLDFDKARQAMVNAAIAAIAKFDPAIAKNDVVLTLNAVEELTKKRGQEATRAAQEKAAAEERAAAAKKPKDETKPATEPAAKEESDKPMSQAELLADVEGISAEDMRRFRAAAYKAQRDPKVKELKAKRAQLNKEAEFLSQEEKKNMRGDFEQLQSDLRTANLAAVTAAAAGLTPETIEKIFEAVETRAREAAAKTPKKSATKTPLKPFPFGDKK